MNLLRFHSPLLERRVGRRDVPRGGEQQPDRQLGGADDVGLRRVDHHHAGLGGRLDVDVVQADARAGDDLELPGRGERLGVDLGRAADQDRVDVGNGRQQRGAVGAVAVADLEVRAERVDGGGRELFGDEDDRLWCLGHVVSAIQLIIGRSWRPVTSTGWSVFSW